MIFDLITVVISMVPIALSTGLIATFGGIMCCRLFTFPKFTVFDKRG